MKPLILTTRGVLFNLLKPEGYPYRITEIAHALSNLCRYTGHTQRFYSVAQHSVLVSHQVPREHALAALLHDAAEAYVGDVAAPLKHQLPGYQAIEQRIQAGLLTTFGLPSVLPACVHTADRILLATEARDLLPPHDGYWHQDQAPLPHRIKPLSPAAARRAFLCRFRELDPGNRMGHFEAPVVPAKGWALGARLRRLWFRFEYMRPEELPDGSVQIGDVVFTRSDGVHSQQADGTWAPASYTRKGPRR